MKKVILSVTAGVMLMAIGCKSGPSNSDPRATLLSFFQALSKKDLKEARKYTTKESEGLFSMMEMALQMSEKMKTEDVDEGLAKLNAENVEIGEAKIDGDRAVVPITNKKDGQSRNMVLKKEDGAWKVAFDKSTMTEMAGKEMKERGDPELNIDSVTNAIQNINTDSLKEVIKKGLNTFDSLKHAMKAKQQ